MAAGDSNPAAPSSAAFLPVLRELARSYQAFERYSAAHIRRLDLTPPQFDIIATLGNTAGMSCKELGERTLITKGTLTGVLDRLERKQLLTRRPAAADKRRLHVALTPAGQGLFERIFPAHLAYLAPAFASLPAARLDEIAAALATLHAAFEPAPESPRG